MVIALPDPVRVSPLIRVSRWTLLGLGVFYGISRNSSLTKKENARRAQEELERPAREAATAVEKAKAYREEMLYLAKETGTPVPPNF
ncbi:unnamed protein product [Allacma fusca]|uniref:ATP synthase F(0) complex subunit e, mitochondrial n=1 Tax=Allacma fusca TaxID=39272 RepID=A0A8J2L5Q2_9HEXA|nr:unnamed protein product [Allacma fusca]